MHDKSDKPRNSWPTANFLEAAQHPFFKYTLETLLLAVDREGRFVYTNRAFERASGFSEHELLGNHFCMLYPESQQEAVRASFVEQLHHGEFASNLVIPMRGKAGESFYINWITATLTNPTETIEYIVGAGIDHTEHRNTLINYRKSQDLFRDLVETSSDWWWAIDTELRFTYSSPQVETILGYRPEEMLGKTPFDFMPADEADKLARHFNRRGKPAPFNREQNINIHKDGRHVTMETSGVPFFSSKGELSGFRGIAHDITDRQNTLQALQKSEERLRLSQQFANFGNWEWDIATGELYWSDQVWTLFGLPVASTRPYLDMFLSYVHPDDRDMVLQAIDDSLYHGSVYDLDHRIVWPDGSIHWVREAGNVVRDADGKPVRMLGLASNIDKRKLHEQEQLRQAEEQRNALIREVHHRIKNNLQGIVGLLRNNLNHTPSDPADAIDKAITQINSIALIHGIHGQRDINKLLLCEMLPAIVEGHSHTNNAATAIDLSLNVDTPLEVLDKEAVPVALILNELITNALKHANRQNAHDKVRVSLDAVHEQGEIRIHCPGGRLPEGFDFQAGMGHGTGLELIQALLPADGFSIQYRQNRAGVTTHVQLRAPIVRPYSFPQQQHQ